MNRANGEIRLEVGLTGLQTLREAGGYRVKFPKNEHLQEAVLVNTAGGLVGGDTLDIHVKADAPLMVSTTGAEKIYGGDLSRLTTKLEVTNALYWLPLETILYNNAQFERSTDIYLTTGAKLIFAEMMVFGRIASGEVINNASFKDIRHIYRENTLIYAENTIFEGDLYHKLDVSAMGNGARAMATIISTEGSLEELRALETPECAFTTRNGLIIARFIGNDGASLRLIYTQILGKLMPNSLPRNW
jgi:urease accessory protein